MKENTISLFKNMKTDASLKKQFIKNPVGVLSEKVLNKKTTTEEISDSNRLLFSILANEKFLTWLNDYSRKNKGISKQRYAADFIKAAVKFGDKNIIANISKYLTADRSIPGFGPVAQQLLINNAAQQIAVTPVNQPSTSDQSAKSSQNFNGVGFGDLAILRDPGFLRSITEILVAKSKELSKAGKLSNINSKIL